MQAVSELGKEKAGTEKGPAGVKAVAPECILPYVVGPVLQ